MRYPVGTVIKRRLKNSPYGSHYGVVVDYYFGRPVVLEKLKDGSFRSVYMSDFADGYEVRVEPGGIEHPMVIRLRADQAVRCAKPWSLWSNCEHFAREIAHGKNESYQFQLGIIAVAVVGILAS